MSMQEQPDNDAAFDSLDRLFRNSAEEFEAPYDPVAWQYMRAKLDERDRIVIWGRFLRWGLAFLVGLVLFSGGWYRFRQSRAQAVAITSMEGRVSGPEQSVIATGTPQTQSKQARGTESTRLVGSTMPETSTKRVPPAESEAANKPIQREQLSGPSTPLRATELALPNEATSPIPAVKNEPGFGKLSSKSTTKTNNPNPTNVKPSVTGRRSSTDIAGRHTMDQPMQTRVGQRRRLRSPVARQPFSAAPMPTVAVNRERNVKGQQTGTPNDGSVLNSTSKTTESIKTERHQSHVNPDAEPPSVLNKPLNAEPAESRTNDIQSGNTAPTEGTMEYRIGPVDAMMGRSSLQWPLWPALEAPLFSQPLSSSDLPPRPTSERGLSIRFIAAPDISSVGLRNLTRPGTNFGILAEYRIASRWVVQAGVIQSRKIYKAGPDDYTMPPNWRWRVMPTIIDGKCKMLDIPINVRYDALLRPMGTGKNPIRLFVAGGVTTYIMNNERYDYTFADPNNPLIVYRFWQGSTGRYNLSHLNLSVGYERSLGRRLAVQVEPFAKVPLRGVGQFKVNLFSTGALFSMRYKL